MASLEKIWDGLDDVSQRLAEHTKKLAPLQTLYPDLKKLLKANAMEADKKNADLADALSKSCMTLTADIQKSVRPISRMASRSLKVWLTGAVVLASAITSVFWGFLRPITDPYALELWGSRYADRSRELDRREDSLNSRENGIKTGENNLKEQIAAANRDIAKRQDELNKQSAAAAKRQKQLDAKAAAIKSVKIKGPYDFFESDNLTDQFSGDFIRGEHYYAEFSENNIQWYLNRNGKGLVVVFK